MSTVRAARCDEIAIPFVADEVETPRLRLRMFAHSDTQALSLITGDPEVMTHIGEGKPLSEAQTEINLDTIIKNFRRRGFGRWALIDKKLDQLIGYCGFGSGNPEVGIELAYLLAKPYWSKGLAVEAALACLRYGFEELQFDAIAGVTRPGNIRSQRVLAKIGMRYLRHAYYYSYDCVHYSITRNEFRLQTMMSPQAHHHQSFKVRRLSL
ncbi:MAG: GNAT family N-acetyltransferase [Pyrinomonadaceae bacterium]